jgi:hypothetical protein
MTGIYYPDILDVLRAAGCQVAESATTNGWQTRARSSGGFPSAPLGVQWHHTASSTSPANDLSWQIVGCDDAPVGNMLLDRTGCFWPVAAGAANTAGKGGPLSLSRGTIPADSANTRTFALEVANSGVGEAWPVAQIDAYFAGSNALNERFGNAPADVFSHALGSGDGWTNRKIDPATAAAVQGPWRPRSVNSSGTWSLADIRAECTRRAGATPAPQPPEDDDMTEDQLNAITSRLDAIAGAQQADFERDGTFGPKADEGISQRSAIYDALGSIGSKLDRLIELQQGEAG